MKEQLISFETAKLAKEKGFNIPVHAMYIKKRNNPLNYPEPEESMYNWNSRAGYSAPTQSLLQKWLREEHNIHIQLHYDCKYKYWEFRNFILNEYIDKEHNKVYFEYFGYNTYEEALEAGLSKALSII
jgi:hypothetical protein